MRDFFAKIFSKLGYWGRVLVFPKFLESNASAYMLGFFCKILKFFTVLIKHFRMYIYKTSVFSCACIVKYFVYVRKVFESGRRTGTFLSPVYSKYPKQIDSHLRTLRTVPKCFKMNSCERTLKNTKNQKKKS